MYLRKNILDLEYAEIVVNDSESCILNIEGHSNRTCLRFKTYVIQFRLLHNSTYPLQLPSPFYVTVASPRS